MRRKSRISLLNAHFHIECNKFRQISVVLGRLMKEYFSAHAQCI